MVGRSTGCPDSARRRVTVGPRAMTAAGRLPQRLEFQRPQVEGPAWALDRSAARNVRQVAVLFPVVQSPLDRDFHDGCATARPGEWPQFPGLPVHGRGRRHRCPRRLPANGHGESHDVRSRFQSPRWHARRVDASRRSGRERRTWRGSGAGRRSSAGAGRPPAVRRTGAS